MGEGKHARFSLHSSSHRALGVAFGRSSLGVEDEDLLDATVRLEVNHWNGSVEPRVVLRELYPLEEPATDEGKPIFSHACSCEEAEWWARFEAELSAGLEAESAPDRNISGLSRTRDRKIERQVVEGAAAPTVAIAELVSSGAGVLAVCADASRRAGLGNGATGLARFNGGAAVIACHRCGDEEIARLAEKADAGLAVTDYAALERAPKLSCAFGHIALVDPPRSELDERRTQLPCGEGEPGFLHLLWSEAEQKFAANALGEQWPGREAVASSFRALRELGEAGGGQLRNSLAGEGNHPLCPEACARRFRVLSELGLLQGAPEGGAGVVRAVSSGKTELQRSAAFRAYSERLSEAQRFLARPKPR
jgi:hypothetical protein